MTARYLTAARLRELEAALSERDYAVLQTVARLRFVSGAQLARLCFTADIRAARRALLRLDRLGVLARLPRPVGGVRAGSAGFVYHLGPAGQRLAMMRGWRSERRSRRALTPGSLFVRHALAVAELHTRLTEAAKAGHCELLALDAEPACWRTFETFGPLSTLKPDSYARLGVGEFEDSYFIEVDRGTEGSRAIERQVKLYLAYHQSGDEQARRGVFPKTLWLTTGAPRVGVIAEVLDRLPPAERELFAVAPFNQALNVMLTAEYSDR